MLREYPHLEACWSRPAVPHPCEAPHGWRYRFYRFRRFLIDLWNWLQEVR